MHRLEWLIVVAGWGFWASPLLCMAGVIEHRCEPLSDACSCTGSERDDSGCDHDSSSCPHEGSCSSDPCNQIATSKTGGAKLVKFAPAHHVALPPPASDGGREQFRPGAGWASETSGRSRRLPLHPSDLPLLI
jgi:hypothetical protein